MPDRQAEAESRALADAFVANSSEFATKGDLRNEIELLRRDMLSMEQRLTIKLGTFIAVAVASTAALVKLL